MKKCHLLFIVLISPLYIFCQQLEVVGEVVMDSIDVQSGTIKNVADPILAQDAATKAYVDLLQTTVDSLEILVQDLQGVRDIDNNKYNVVTIGTQTWMAENLKTTRYNDGTIIPLATNPTDWSTAGTNATAAYCWYDNDASNLITYGAIYNWYAIDTLSNGSKNICPTDWHIPTDADWITLITHLGGDAVAGGKMKEAGLAHWETPNTGATNEAGFTSLPGGLRIANGSFFFIYTYGYWWSSLEMDSADAWLRGNVNNTSTADRLFVDKGAGISVRCLKD